MYNMNFSLFGCKMNITTLFFIAIVIILISHTYCGCHDPYALIEGMDNNKKEEKNKESTMMPEKDSSKKDSSTKEGFSGANTNYGQSSPYDLTINNSVDTSSWAAPNMVVTPGQPLNPAVKEFLARPKQQLPLPEGEMDFFANAQFKPECCPSAYSNSNGCWCGDSTSYNYLIQRGGNNVPYSEY